MIGFGFNEFSRDGSYELYTYVDVDYNTSKAIISTRINTDYNINIGFKVYINNVLLQEFGTFDLLPSSNFYTFTTSIDTTKDNSIKVEVVSNKNGIYNQVTANNKSENIPKKVEDEFSSSFDKRYDKVTEHEVVDDFISRLYIGKDIYGGSTQLLSSDKKLVDYISQLFMSNPLPEGRELSLIRFNVDEGVKSLSATILGDVSDYKIYRAYADRSRLDVSGIFNYDISGNKFYTKAEFDTPYPSDDIINLLIITN